MRVLLRGAGQHSNASDEMKRDNERVNVANEARTPDVNGQTALNPRRGAREAPLRSKQLECRNDHSSPSAADERDEDHRPGGRTDGLIRVSEDDVDAEGRHAHDAGEAVNKAEKGLAREGGEGKEEGGEAEFVSEEGEEAAPLQGQ